MKYYLKIFNIGFEIIFYSLLQNIQKRLFKDSYFLLVLNMATSYNI